jgi:hypothetical protein
MTGAIQTKGRIEAADSIEPQRSNNSTVNGTPSFTRETSATQVFIQDESPTTQSIPPSLDIHAQTARLRKTFAPRQAAAREPAYSETNEGLLELSACVSAPETEADHGQAPLALARRATRAKADIEHALDDLGRELNSDSLIKSTDEAVLACRKLRALTDAMQSFLEQFADVTSSPASPSQFGTTNRPIRDSEDSLQELRRVVTRVLSIVEEAGNFGVNSVQDLEQMIAADKDLPDETPPGHLVKTLNDVDSVRFGVLLGQYRKLLKVMEELNFTPELSSAPDEALVCASNIAAVAAKSGYVQLLPAQAFSEAVKKREDARTLISVVESATTALGLLEFDRSFPASGLDAVALAAIVAARLPSSHRNYFRWSSSGGADTFHRAHERWSELVSVDAEWRERLSGYSPDFRSSPEELESAVAHFSGSTIRRARTEFAAAGMTARELVTRLGFHPQSTRIREDLESLIFHLRAVRRFCTNASYHQMFGSEWAGLETPFDDIATAARTIQRIKSHFITVAHGRRVFDRLILLEDAQLETLGLLASSMDELRALSNDLKSRFDERSVEALISELESEQHLAEAILEADPERLAASIDLPLSKIHESSVRETLRRELADSIAGDPLAPAVERLANSDATTEAALKAITWISIIRRKELAPELRTQLLSENAVRVRERVRELSNRAAAILRVLDDHVTKFKKQHKLRGLTPLSLPELLTRIDNLIARRDESPSVLNIGQNESA